MPSIKLSKLETYKWIYESNTDLAPSEVSVLLNLLYHRNAETGQCNPSVRRIAKETRLGVATVKRCLLRLKAKNILVQAKSMHRSSHWFFKRDMTDQLRVLTANNTKYKEFDKAMRGKAKTPNPEVSP